MEYEWINCALYNLFLHTQTKENVRTESPQLDEDDQLSSKVDQKQDLQTLLKQLQSEQRDLLTQVEQLGLTGTSLHCFARPCFFSFFQYLFGYVPDL